MNVSSLLANDQSRSTRSHAAKSVCFELLLDDRSKTRARIPLRVLVNTHDTTESIITTVKSFYGIYDGNPVSFEDAAGNTLIASYDNFNHDTTVYVRSVAGQAQPPQPVANIPDSPRKPSLGDPFSMLPPHMREHSRSPSRRSSSRNFSKRSVSPSRDRGRRSNSQQQRGSRADSRNSSAHGSYRDNDFSDSDAGQSSISGSKRARSEQFASSEISAANVLQDGRRGGPIFDSSTLPLFMPPQVPVTASQSSISPQRRSLPHEGPSPFQMPAAKLYSMEAPPMLSPQSYGAHNGRSTHSHNNSTTTPANHSLRNRNSSLSGGRARSGILPTPDPTVASCISDEDVARTLIALGDVSNFSHGRTSTSTMDDTFSGAADAASSTGATSDSDEYSDTEGLCKHRKSLDQGDEDYETHIKSEEYDEHDGPPKTKKIKTKMHDGPSGNWKSPGLAMKSSKSGKSKPSSGFKTSKPTSGQGQMKAPALTGKPRQASSSSSLNFQLPQDEEDLSTKPRCQRCRKSKKGCDRQRPCGRCKDAGIGIEGCVSEDEGNGRKGRYGRHMGVTVKKDSADEAVFLEPEAMNSGTAIMSVEAVTHGSPSKKRKR
ncbi:hypothetical protein LTR70_001046 [Exophiala xenobiotica]|uniref:Zn(2)-C6 fungal-type domain-containing protein n=1 Tax=Lithohypha guttulata TaxID=1690604 RepID=A0ABR0KMX3_9EURO|nr:hypothetical protein LTR24_000764 [Lithohypha guttulata]KAK5328892.1 hypothetical protein LTR70_001046 [Exophiala xenobiotica]